MKPFRRAFDVEWRRFKLDAARWLVPEAVGDVEQLTPARILRLLWTFQGLRAMFLFRAASCAKAVGLRGVPMLIHHRLLVRYGLELMAADGVGGGLYIAHPVGCTLVAERIGENVTVIGAVTFGYKVGRGWPTIDDNAYVGAGARVLGRVHVGKRTMIGANAVVVDDVPEETTVVGVPARVVGPSRIASPGGR